MRVAILCDSPDEKWPSMDLVGVMLAEQLTALGIDHEVFAPGITRRTGNFSADRLLFRFGAYPDLVRSLRNQFDVFHIVDHSYSQLALKLPRGRVVVTCHDLDTFRSVLEPERVPRGLAFRWMTRRVLSGFQRAAFVGCDSETTRAEIRKFDLLPSDKLSVVPLGVHPSCSTLPNEIADRECERLLGGFAGTVILHVGSTLPRKRIDVLLRTCAAVRARHPDARLVRVGGPLTDEQRKIANELNLTGSLIELPFLSRDVLAAVYRRAALVLQPSEAEGFGLPVVEAMACGTPVIASDLPVLREVGGDAVAYCPVGDIEIWSTVVTGILTAPSAALRESALAQANRFSWKIFAQCMAEVYNKMLNA